MDQAHKTHTEELHYDYRTTQNGYQVAMDVIGSSPNDIEITVKDRYLTVDVVKDCIIGSQQITLPRGYDGDITAESKNGILTISI